MVSTVESATDFGFRPLSWGLFLNQSKMDEHARRQAVFVPFLGDFFSNITIPRLRSKNLKVFVPFLGDFFSSVPAKPQPVCSRKRISGGDGGSLHQALSFGDEMPIFPVRTGIGGDLQ